MYIIEYVSSLFDLANSGENGRGSIAIGRIDAVRLTNSYFHR